MAPHHFDALAHTLRKHGRTTGTRRALSGLLATLFSVLGPRHGEQTAAHAKQTAGQRRGRKKQEQKKVHVEGPCGNGSSRANRCRKNRQCCTGYCDKGKGKRRKGKKNQKNTTRTGRCRCRKLNQSCAEDRNCCPERTGRICIDDACQPAPTCIGLADPCALDLPCCEDLICQDDQCLPELCVETCLAGCCAGESCQAGNTPEFCGAGGTSCQSCSGAAPVCYQAGCVCGDVCADVCRYPTIQAAVNDGDGPTTIRLCAGAYRERVTVNRTLTLIGTGQGETGGTTLDGQHGGAVVTVIGGAALTLQTLRITRGSASGVFVSSGAAMLDSCTVTLNSDPVAGGGLYTPNADSVAILTNSTVSENAAGSLGGGFYNPGGNVTLTSTNVTGNTAGQDGGGIFNAGAVTLTGASHVDDNHVGAVENNCAGDGSYTDPAGACA